MRLPMKPSQTPETTPTFLIFFDSAIVVASTSLPVALPRTISSSRITLAGEKKWVPITSCGRLVKPAILSTSSVEVFDAKIAPGFIVASSVSKTVCLTAMSSNTASTTMSACARSPYDSVGVIIAMRCSTCSWVIRPFLAVPS